MKKGVYVVIPAFNEARVIVDVIREVQAAGDYKIVVVDDGSRDGTFQQAASCPGVVALRHKINRGKGAATKTGIVAANKIGADIIVTIDGDGQGATPSPLEGGVDVKPGLRAQLKTDGRWSKNWDHLSP